MKTILITGANGFIAKNLITHLSFSYKERYKVLKVYRSSTDEELKDTIDHSDLIVHLAGENRPQEQNGFVEGNVEYTKKICSLSKKRNIPIIFTSSTQVELNNNYARSKLEAENVLKEYSEKADASVCITRLPNVFGKWSKPNYNSFIATMCYNLWHDLPLNIDDSKKEITLVYIDDVVNEIILKINDLTKEKKRREIFVDYFDIKPQYKKKLGDIYEKLKKIKNSQQDFNIHDRARGFNKSLAATFMSYCPKDKLNYSLIEHNDHRGSFYEIFKLGDYGQISVSTTKPGITRGNHFHHSKQEKFLVVKGACSFKFRSLDTGEVISFKASDQFKEVVEVPLGYTHNFTNVGEDELVVLIWCNEAFDKNNPDTYSLEV